MIRIETTAEFDAEGRFTLHGQTLLPVTPGQQRVVLVVLEASDQAKSGMPGPLTSASGTTGPVDLLIEKDGLLLLNAEPEASADLDIRALIEADREERLQHILGDWQP